MSAPLPIEPRADGQWSLLLHGTEVWCRDKGLLERIRNAMARQEQGPLSGQGPLLPVSEFTRLYWPGGEEAHLAHPAGLGIFCEPDVDTDSMRGSASHQERVHAAKLPTCADCRRWSRAMRAVR